MNRLVAHAERIIHERRTALEGEFGWTYLQVAVKLHPDERRLLIDGEVLLPGIAATLGKSIAQAAEPDWAVSIDLRPVTDKPWRHLRPGVTWLQRAFPGSGRPATLTTELLGTDGPVQCLATMDGATLVRSIDGTVGWTSRPLGRLAPPPGAAPVRFDRARLQRTLRSYLGVPYVLGGTSRSGIDCSALVQRCLGAASNTIIPRHSLDQLAAAGRAGRPLGEPGDVLYSWTSNETACHVGVILARGRRRTVIHASTSRGRVVEEPLDRYLSRLDRVAHAEPAQFLDRGPWQLPA